MKMIVGLGNPGPKYERNRHNIGFILLDAIVNETGAWRDKFNAREMRLKKFGTDIILLKPQTYMNKSGISVQAVASFYKIGVEDMLVIHDELDLAPGQIKYKKGGGHAGHNGLRSIAASLSPDFDRLRVGIGHPGDKARVADYVLNDFSKSDNDWIAKYQDNIEGAIEHWINKNPSQFVEKLRGHKSADQRQKVSETKRTNESINAAENKKESPFEALKFWQKKT